MEAKLAWKSQLTPWDALELQGPTRVDLHWVGTVMLLGLCLDLSLGSLVQEGHDLENVSSLNSETV